MRSYSIALIGAVVCLSILPAAEQERVVGIVTQADAPARTLTVKADSGSAVAVKLDDAAVCLRVPPGEKDLKKAEKIAPADISPGDRVLARGRLAPDGASLAASSVILMSGSDLAEKRRREREAWRGATRGTVVSTNPPGGEIVIAPRGRDAAQSMVVEGAAADFLRYAPDSVRFEDARPGSLADIRPGDTVIVLGERDPEGARIKAARIVSGSFRSLAATVVSVDTAAGELRVTDLETKKPLAVRINGDSTLRRLPAGVAAVRDVQPMLDRMPALQLSELKPGDAVIVSATRGADANRLTAITLLAGVEPLLRAAPSRQGAVGGAWNFGDIVLPQ